MPSLGCRQCRLQVGFYGRYWSDIKLLYQYIECRRCDKCRQAGVKPKVLDTKVQPGQKNRTAHLLVPGQNQGKRQITDPAIESLGQSAGGPDSGIGIVALSAIKKPWNGSDIAKFQHVEPILSAS